MNGSAAAEGEFRGELLLDNDTAFESKLAAIRGAKRTLDLAYYIFSDDYSTSLIAEELVAAAKRGVAVRLLVDYQSAYPLLDFFNMLEQRGSDGPGSLEIRFYNRPTNHILRDAAFLALSCADVGKSGDFKRCAKAKYEFIDSHFRNYLKGTGLAPDDPRPSNFSLGGSDLLTSALYAKDTGLIAKIIWSSKAESRTLFKKEVPSVPSSREETANKVKSALDAAKTLWTAEFSDDPVYRKLQAKLKLAAAFTFFGSTVNPLYDALTSYVPVDRPEEGAAALRDWEYWTEFLHHKLLLADERTLIVGGRNMEDSYHLSRNPFSDRYVFMDTDLAVTFGNDQPMLRARFEQLWSFQTMTATLRDVNAHAGNDFLMGWKAATDRCPTNGISPADQACWTREFLAQHDRLPRLERAHVRMKERSAAFRSRYKPVPIAGRKPVLVLDEQSKLTYLENLPFSWDAPGAPQRMFGSPNGEEGEHGKHIHAVWLRALDDICSRPPGEGARELVLHNAYFFLPSNLLAKLGEMVDGTLDCRGVKIYVITNSSATTDLNVINLLSRHSMAAFGEHYRKRRHPEKGAEVKYFEYLKQGQGESSSLSLHSKVNVFGPNLFIGSANTDARSFLLDTNNGMFVQNAPVFRAAYMSWLGSLLQDRTLLAERTDMLLHADHVALLEADKPFLHAMLTTLIAEEGKPPQLPLDPIVEFLSGYLSQAYELSAKILERRRGSAESAERFNSFYKVL